MRLIDTHAHLDEVHDLDLVVERARLEGVVAIIAVGTGHASNEKTLRLSQTFPDYIFPALGIHPGEIPKDVDVEIGWIEGKLDQCVAVGEVGLDYWIKRDKKTQRRVFRRLLELAVKQNKPVSIHSRGAWEDTYHFVEEYDVEKAVFHWYSGSIEILHKIFDRGYLVSATPATEFSKAHRIAIEKTPLDNLLLETDSPVKYRGVEAEPATVVKTLKMVAALKKIPEKTVAEKTTENAVKLFHLNL